MKQKSGYMKIGLTVFCTACAILLFYDTLFGRHVLQGFGKQLVRILAPLIYGALLAYLLAPIVNFIELGFFEKRVEKAVSQGKLVSRGVRAVSLLITWIVIGLLAYLAMSVLLPELYRSVVQLIGNIESYYITISGWVEHLLETNPVVGDWVTAKMDGYFLRAEQWLETDALPQAAVLMTALTGGVMSVIGFFSDLLVGVIVSVYLLATKERFSAQSRKVAYSLFSRENVYWVLRGARKADDIFSGFIRGKLLDSLIIGIICFVGCSLLKFPYTPLVSVIVGVTNVIPFFGPFLGAIPSSILILLASPMKGLYFILFVIALQQLDGNIIGPKILGDSTGLSSLWVIIAILVGGGFFGFVGMFFAVPVFGCIYSAVTFYVETRLRKKSMPVATECYVSDMPAEADDSQEKK